MPSFAIEFDFLKRYIPGNVRRFLFWIGVLFLTFPNVAVPKPVMAEDANGLDFFERKIRPLLAKHCYECHSNNGKALQGELALDNRAGILHGGESGPVLVPGKPDESALIGAVRYDGDVQMPPNGKLPAEEIALLTEWVRSGAPLPDDGSAKSSQKAIDYEQGRKFWSFQPPRASPPPMVKRTDWGQRPIDIFLLHALEQRGLSPGKAADARTLLRRATLDLTGLPPSMEDVERLLADDSPDAYSRLLDQLLASPHYGERWGRYWLDLARFADSNETSLELRPNAWLYRDWVVQALNEDLPYNRFVIDQLAVDQLPDHRPEQIAALGFLGISPAYFKELKLSPTIIKAIVADEWEERMDAVGRTFLGLTLACARCHDHKFDPISAEDYYAIAGVFANSRLTDRYVIPDASASIVRQAHQQVASLGEQVKKLKASKTPSPEEKAKVVELEAELKKIETETPHYHTALAHAVDDAALFVLPNGPNSTKLDYKPGEAVNLQVQIRGNPSKPGATVPRRFLAVLSTGSPQPFTHGSGRLELAQAIVKEGAPLSARVIVNRVWKQHFGRGLVETTSDFGSQGGRPSHPELLDDLTVRFMDNGWSIKWLHREIMLSAAYQQSSAFDAEKFNVDPENRFLWRMNRRRLDVESWRDSMLSVSGALDLRMGGASLALTDAKHHRRTLYSKISRADLDTMLRLFDFPDPSAHSPDREPTTTALQQLYVLNSMFVAKNSAAVAQSLVTNKHTEVPVKIRFAYRTIFAREPREKELQVGLRFLAPPGTLQPPTATAWQQFAQALLGSNEFLFID